MALAAYAMRECCSLGRRFEERPHPYRTDYQRDRDRVIHTKAFRRLEKKTQVFATDYSDHFRNRLTHTLEVSQISRTISEALELNTDLCEVLALSHDIGHPPYSHEGERVLDSIMRVYGEGFDHNLHALRIVEDFEEKYAAFRGLNLTFEVREGIIKHSRDYGVGARTYVDISGYQLGRKPPLEAQLIDLADEIAYNTADLDDGCESGLLDVEMLYSHLELFKSLWDDVVAEYPLAEEKLKLSEVIRRLIDVLVSGLVENTRANLRLSGIGSVDQVREHPNRLVNFDASTADLNGELKAFLRSHLYAHSALASARSRAERQIEDLFAYFSRNPDRLPASHHDRIDELGLQRVVCDYIAGMTDNFAETRHAEILSSKVAVSGPPP